MGFWGFGVVWTVCCVDVDWEIGWWQRGDLVEEVDGCIG